MQYRTITSTAGQTPCALISMPKLMDCHRKVVGDNIAYFSGLVFNHFSNDDHLSDVYAQLDKLYLENMSPEDKNALVSAYMQIDCVLCASHSMADKAIQIEQLHHKIDAIVTKVVACFDDISQQRLQFLSEHL